MNVERIVNPVRVFQQDAGLNSITSGVGQFAWAGYSIGGLGDLALLLSNINNYAPTTVAPFAQSNADQKFMIESCDQVMHGTNTCNMPIRVTCYWLKPHRDLYPNSVSTASSINPSSLLHDPPASINAGGALSANNLGFNIYSCDVPRYWHIYKRKTCIIMPGCSAEWTQSFKKKVLCERTLVGQNGVSVSAWPRSTSRFMLFQVCGSEDVELTGSAGAHSVNQAQLSMHGTEKCVFRAMLDPRPIYQYTGSNVAEEPATASDAVGINPISGAVTNAGVLGFANQVN